MPQHRRRRDYGYVFSCEAKGSECNSLFLFLSDASEEKPYAAYVDGLDSDRRDRILNKAVTFDRKQRDSRRRKQKDLQKELIRQQDQKKQERNQAKMKELERKLKKGELDPVLDDFPGLDESVQSKLKDVLEGKVWLRM